VSDKKKLKIFNFQKRAIAFKCAQIEIYFYTSELFKEILTSNAHAHSIETPLYG